MSALILKRIRWFFWRVSSRLFGPVEIGWLDENGRVEVWADIQKQGNNGDNSKD